MKMKVIALSWQQCEEKTANSGDCFVIDNGEELVVYLHQLALTDSRHSLLCLGRFGDRAESDLCHACADSARRDENYLNARVLHIREDLDAYSLYRTP